MSGEPVGEQQARLVHPLFQELFIDAPQADGGGRRPRRAVLVRAVKSHRSGGPATRHHPKITTSW